MKKLRIFDFDDTIAFTKAKVYLHKQDGTVKPMTPAEYAVYEQQPGDTFDYGEFHQLIEPEEIKWTANILRNVIAKNGPNGAFILTARAKEEPVYQFFDMFNIPRIQVIALADANPQAKAQHVLYMIKKFRPELVEFFDDSYKNAKAVEALTTVAKKYGTSVRSHHVVHKDPMIHEQLLDGSSSSKEKKIGFIGGGFKPFTKGHFFIIQKAAQDNDLVHLYIGMGDRARPGELPITWVAMQKVWSKYLLKIMPSNVIVKPATNPVGSIYEQMMEYEASGNQNLELYVYGDENDLRAYYTERKLSKYVPNLYAKGKVHMLGFDRAKGVNISGTELRRRISAGDAKGFMEGLPEPLQNPKIAADIIKMLVPKPVKELKEGGLAGHMSHMHEDLSLTFGELKQILSVASEGKLENITEKLDGQNIFFTFNVTANELRFARNKGDIKSGGMNLNAILAKWANKPSVAKSFGEAYKALSAGASSLPNKEQIFGTAGNIWYNAEILYKENVNVIDYGTNSVVIHKSGVSYDSNGNPLNVDTSANYDALINAVDAMQNQSKQQTGWDIQKPVVVQLARLLDNKPQKEAVQKIDRLESQYGLSDASTVGDLARIIYANNVLKPILGNMDDSTLNDIAAIILDQSASVNQKKQDLIDVGLSKEEIVAIGKNMSADLGKHIKQATLTIEHIIHEFATELLKGVNSALLLNPTKESSRLQAETQQAIEKLKSMPDENVKQFLAYQLPKLKDINDITAIEGIVFNYNGKTYKLTGAFSPVNKLLGAFKYGL